MGSTQSTASSETEGNGTTSSQSTISEKTAKALYAILSILLIALLAMVFMQYRLRKRLARLQKGQSTVGRWMNHHDFDFENNRMKPRKGSPSSENEEDMRSMSSSNNLYIASGSSGQQPNSTSAFHHNRSSSSSTHISRSSSTSTTRRRPTSLSSNPFADDAQELDEEDIIHRSASQAKRHSHAESSISDSNTIMTSDTFTSSSGRLSSIAPSDQQSSIGNVSVVSDDHYHRAKAFTITRGNGLPSTTGLGRGEFLDPHSVFMESRR